MRILRENIFFYIFEKLNNQCFVRNSFRVIHVQTLLNSNFSNNILTTIRESMELKRKIDFLIKLKVGNTDDLTFYA